MRESKSKRELPFWFWPLITLGVLAILIDGYSRIYYYLTKPHWDAQQKQEETVDKIEYTKDVSRLVASDSKQNNVTSEAQRQPDKTAKITYSSTSTSTSNNPDLLAQEGMWRAANSLVWLTFVQALVGTLTWATQPCCFAIRVKRHTRSICINT